MNNEKMWETKISSLLVGRTITGVFIMSAEDADETGWAHRPVVLEFDDGLQLMPSSDDEGNDAGAMITSNDVLPTIPVF